MSAAIVARGHGLNVMVIDDQATAGGQIWRSIETTKRRDDILGPSYVEGRVVTKAFRASGAQYRPGTQLWQIEPGFTAFVTKDGQAEAIEARTIIFATGAQERPAPFLGWTLPGVLTVGAAQILLKSAGQVPVGPVWIVASGPLPLLYADQFLRAGGQLAGYLDTTPPGQWRKASRYLPGALRATGDLLKGLRWQFALRASGTRVISGVTKVEALGEDKVEGLRFRDRRGATHVAEASTLLIHEGVVPSIHPTLSLDCEVRWDTAQDCYAPVVDPWGETTCPGVFVCGDGAGIAGAKAALLTGQLAGLRASEKLGRITAAAAAKDAEPLRKKLDHELAPRPFLDALFRPRREIFEPSDKTTVCRCEEVTAGDIRALAKVGRPGPNQLKSATRVGMGPCQGRQCGYTVMRILGAAQNRAPSEVGFFHVRAPLKPLTLGELASLPQTVPAAWDENSED
jgi:NADPH-dependent 2,4-dienoyl-CoA reductase/sulfur reductase-like enzyme